MNHVMDVIALAHKKTVTEDHLQLIERKDQKVTDYLQFSVRRFIRQPNFVLQDAGLLRYHVEKGQPAGNYLELCYCVEGFSYNEFLQQLAGVAAEDASRINKGKTACIDVIVLRFDAESLDVFRHAGNSNSFIESILGFTHPASFSKTLSICGRTRLVLENILGESYSYTEAFETLLIDAQSQLLLLYALEGLVNTKEEEIFECRFLANDTEREKIFKSREILLQHISQPMTVKALSRKVGMNQCYLKKGFKELFGTTILEFSQHARMEHARYLLFEKGLSVTDVSIELGYSSISHFSIAFKRETGLKPCELLIARNPSA